jgi:hypothetical protein
MRALDHVVCSSPECDWGCYLPDLSENRLNDCCADFRWHCIEKHGLNPEDTEVYVHIDLIYYTLTLQRLSSG